jgi:hypothetical protein
MTAAFSPSFELMRLFEKVSARGTRYMVGRLGGARVTLLPGELTEEGTPTWRLLLQEAPQKSPATTERSPSASLRARSSYPRRQRPVAAPGSVSPMPNDSVADLWADGKR